nr:low molecular weight protein arginine phosphatase [uncultured Agathobaculum sp.]
MDKIIFICTGNTCRSPMAEGLFRAHGGEDKTGLTAASAGLFTQDGMPASQNAVAAAAELGADITAHRSRMLTPELARDARYLVCMTGAHYDRLCELFPDCADKVFTLLPEDISDPFGGDLETYRRAAAEIDKGVRSIIERLSQ